MNRNVIIVLILVLALAIPVDSVKADLTTGLVGYWPLNGDAEDLSGNGNHGTIVGDVVSVADRLGTADSAMNFPGNTNSYIDLGQPDEAVEQLTEAARIEPKDPRAYGLLGDFYLDQGEAEKAAAAYGLALQRDPHAVHALERLASLVIAEPGSPLYNEKQAMLLATEACELTDYQDPQVLITLSEVFAATGSKEDAVGSATAALRAAEARGDAELAGTIRAKLKRFKAL